MPIIDTISAVVFDQRGKILLLKRNSQKKWFANKWDVVSEKIKEGEKPDDCLVRALKEEISQTKFRVLKEKGAHLYTENGQIWREHIYLVEIDTGKIKLNAEHTDYCWTERSQLTALDLANPVIEIFKIL